nr:hypothetical protein [Pandoravirus massiliensis]
MLAWTLCERCLGWRAQSFVSRHFVSRQKCEKTQHEKKMTAQKRHWRLPDPPAPDAEPLLFFPPFAFFSLVLVVALSPIWPRPARPSFWETLSPWGLDMFAVGMGTGRPFPCLLACAAAHKKDNCMCSFFRETHMQRRQRDHDRARVCLDQSTTKKGRFFVLHPGARSAAALFLSVSQSHEKKLFL